MRFAALVLACLWPCALWSQSQTTHQFYVDLHSVSTVGLAEEGSSETTPHSLNKFGITCGNEFTLRGPLRLALEFYYYDNKLVVAEEGDDRFELHQCLGANLKPGLSYGTFKTFAIAGINAVYLFDKNERSGSQVDRFDESLFWGVEQQCQVTKNLRVSLGVIHSKFERSSFYTSSTLKQFRIFKIGLGCTIDASKDP